MIKNTLIITASACILTACAATSTTPKTTSPTDEPYVPENKVSAAMLEAARDSEKTGDSAQALMLYQKVYLKEPDNPHLALLYASSLRQTGHLNDAKTILTPFAAAEDADANIISEFALIHLMQGDNEIAEGLALSLLDKNDKRVKALQVLGISLSAQGRHEEAVETFLQALTLEELSNKDKSALWNNLALVYLSKGQKDEAETAIKKALPGTLYYSEILNNQKLIKNIHTNVDNTGYVIPDDLPETTPPVPALKGERSGVPYPSQIVPVPHKRPGNRLPNE